MKVDELIGSLLTYEMPFEADQSEKKPKGVAFKAANSDSLSQNSDVANDSYEDTLAMLAKNFGKIMRRLEK